MAFKTFLGLTGLTLAVTMAVVTAQGSSTAKNLGPVAAALPPLPNPGFAPARPMETMRLAYEFAARHPEIIKYVPCYCGCERDGHTSNESCFVHSRDAKGNVTWDAHGWGCTVCVDVAADAARMYTAGADAASIRTATDRKWAGRFPTAMATPKPPQAHKH